MFSSGLKGLTSPGNGKQARRQCQVLKKFPTERLQESKSHLLHDLEFKAFLSDSTFFQQLYLRCTNTESLDSFLHKFDFSTLIIVVIVHHLDVIMLYLSIPKWIHINLVT